MDNHDDEPGVPRRPIPSADDRVGDVPTLGELYRAHADFVWRTLLRFGIPEHAAEDVVHEVFLVARRRLAGFDPSRASPRSWLYGLARGVAANWRRSDRRAERRRLELEPPERSGDPDDEVARAEAAALVERFIATLGLAQREVFVLCDVEGLRAPEVAMTLGCGLNQVYSRLRLARQRFVAFLAEHGVAIEELR